MVRWCEQLIRSAPARCCDPPSWVTADKREGWEERGVTRLPGTVTRACKHVNRSEAQIAHDPALVIEATEEFYKKNQLMCPQTVLKPDNEQVLIPLKSSAVLDCQII